MTLVEGGESVSSDSADRPSSRISDDFFGTLFEFRLPITPLPRKFDGQSSRMIGETDLLGVGFFGGIHMFVTIPEPLVLERRIERAKRIGQIALDENGFAEPSGQQFDPETTRAS